MKWKDIYTCIENIRMVSLIAGLKMEGIAGVLNHKDHCTYIKSHFVTTLELQPLSCSKHGNKPSFSVGILVPEIDHPTINLIKITNYISHIDLITIMNFHRFVLHVS